MSQLILLAQAVDTTSISAEAIFGGVVLLFVLGMIVRGKLRLDREVAAKQEVISIHEQTIRELRQTVNNITRRDETTHHLLQEIRDLAYKEAIKEELFNKARLEEDGRS